MRLAEIQNRIDVEATPVAGESIDMIGLRCSRIRVIAARASDNDREEAQFRAHLAVERVRRIARQRISKELSGLDLRKSQRGPAPTVTPVVLRSALERSDGNVSHAARMLGVQPQTIHRAIRKHAMKGEVARLRLRVAMSRVEALR